MLPKAATLSFVPNLSNDQQSLRSANTAYCAKYAIKPQFAISALYDLHNDWSTTFHFANDTGCYVLYDEDKSLLYIGKASLNHTIGRRVASYFQGRQVEGKTLSKANMIWTRPPAFLETIKVDHYFETPSLEEYLIGRLQPCDNSRKGPLITD